MSTKTKLALIGAGYAAILAFAAVEFYLRYRWALANPVDASGGMAAFGDMVLQMFIALLLMIPTLFLLRIGARFEKPYTRYSKVLLIAGVSAPLCFALLFVTRYLPPDLAAYCFLRLLWSPFVLGLIMASRVWARFERAKRFTSYALICEAATLCASLAMIMFYSAAG